MKENDLNIHVQGTLPIAAFGHGNYSPWTTFDTHNFFGVANTCIRFCLKKLGS